MNSKLEERLYLYERDHPIHSDQDLLAALEAILDEQDSFPVEQKDFDLIAEATEFALHLQGYSDEQLTEMANASGKRILDRIHGKSIPPKRRTSKSRRTRFAWIILVAIVGALTITSVSASIKGVNILTATKELVISIIKGKNINTDDQSYEASSNIKNYDSVRELLNDFDHYELMIPQASSEQIDFTRITSIFYDDELSINLSLYFPSLLTNASVVIIHNDDSQPVFIPNDSINSFDVMTFQYNDYYQCDFIDTNGNYYTIQSTSFETINLYFSLLGGSQ